VRRLWLPGASLKYLIVPPDHVTPADILAAQVIQKNYFCCLETQFLATQEYFKTILLFICSGTF